MTQDVTAHIDIAATVERVWRVMTGEGLVEQWLGCQRFRCEIGHVFYMQPDAEKRAANDISGATHCQIESLEPPNRLIFSWYLPDQPKTTVALSLDKIPTGTRASLRHCGWNQFNEAEIKSIHDALVGGWTSYVLPNLKRLSETR